MFAHPLLLIALGRLTGRTSSENEATIFFKQFAELFPCAVTRWLTPEEQILLDKENSSVTPSTLYVQHTNDPVTKWEALKRSEQVESKGMEKLLQMIGLKKVKNAIIYLFKAAIVLKKMDLEAQETNLMSHNFCFLGNPVSWIKFKPSIL